MKHSQSENWAQSCGETSLMDVRFCTIIFFCTWNKKAPRAMQRSALVLSPLRFYSSPQSEFRIFIHLLLKILLHTNFGLPRWQSAYRGKYHDILISLMHTENSSLAHKVFVIVWCDFFPHTMYTSMWVIFNWKCMSHTFLCIPWPCMELIGMGLYNWMRMTVNVPTTLEIWIWFPSESFGIQSRVWEWSDHTVR